jgi:hypothetical protein
MFLIFFMMVTVGLESSEAKEIKRSCKAEYRYHIASARSESTDMLLYTFKSKDKNKYLTLRGKGNREMIASGKCRSAFPNRCRQRAAKQLKQCAQAHHRNFSSNPPQCKSIQNYPVNLEKNLTNGICRLFHTEIKPGINDPLKLVVKGAMHIWGNKGCGGGKKVKQTAIQKQKYIDCP